jgi:predicted DNA-binding protein YlxM (UPF0122 family)
MRSKKNKISNANSPKRNTLSGVQKKELCKMKHDNPSLTGVELAKKYEISEQSVSDILKRSDFWLNLDDDTALAQAKRQRKVNYPNIEEAMSMWVERAIWNGFTITDHILQVKAKEFADRFGVAEFNASAGWITNFKRRNSLSSYRRRGEIGSAPLQDIPRYRNELQTLLQNFELKIFLIVMS